MFESEKGGKSVLQGEGLRVASEDAGYKRVNRIVQEFFPEPSLNKVGDTFFSTGLQPRGAVFMAWLCAVSTVQASTMGVSWYLTALRRAVPQSTGASASMDQLRLMWITALAGARPDAQRRAA